MLPRDNWLMNRAYLQPSDKFFEGSVGGLATMFENIAAAESVKDLALRMEAAGLWLRLDPNVWPKMIHGAIVSEAEMELMRRVENRIRMGYVQRIEIDKMVLAEGEVDCGPHTLFVDCTAKGVPKGYLTDDPVISPTAISLKMVRLFQPAFSAAIIGYVEATVDDEAMKQRLTQTVEMPDTVEDWVESQIVSMANQHAWSEDKGLLAWVTETRLDRIAKLTRNIGEEDVDKRAIVERMIGSIGPAVQNLQSLAGR